MHGCYTIEEEALEEAEYLTSHTQRRGDVSGKTCWGQDQDNALRELVETGKINQYTNAADLKNPHNEAYGSCFERIGDPTLPKKLQTSSVIPSDLQVCENDE